MQKPAISAWNMALKLPTCRPWIHFEGLIASESIVVVVCILADSTLQLSLFTYINQSSIGLYQSILLSEYTHFDKSCRLSNHPLLHSP
jgi:hypothetical protein